MRFFLGCCAYRTIEPATAVSREALLAALEYREWDEVGNPPGLLDLGDGTKAECLGGSIAHGYGAPKNLEILMDTALSLGADVLVHHDADIRFSPADVRSLLATWLRVGPDAYVGSLYPAADDPSVLVGVLDGVPSVRGAFTRREDVAAALAERQAVAALQLGGGLMALPTRFYRERVRPWFGEELGADGNMAGPDVLISEAFRRAGWKIVADLGARPMHLSRQWLSA